MMYQGVQGAQHYANRRHLLDLFVEFHIEARNASSSFGSRYKPKSIWDENGLFLNVK